MCQINNSRVCYQVNQDIEVVVNSTAPLKYVSYQVLGRGDVIIAATVSVPQEQRTASWRFLATHAMAPTAHVVVQFIQEDGEVVADALDIELGGVLQNFVSKNYYFLCTICTLLSYYYDYII